VERRVCGDVVHPREILGGFSLLVFPHHSGNIRSTRGHEE
jgi:hypothetical protein